MSGWPNSIKSAPNVRTSVGQRPRNRSFPWCRRPNGFSDNPKWRAVKARSGLDLCTVLAFVNRLEELGNDAANRGDIRGSVAGFKTEDFAAALDITPEDANRLFAALEHPDIGWVADGMIADFIDRNPDIEDPTSGERKRRERTRAKILRRLGELATLGQIISGERAEIESNLLRLDHRQLVELLMDLEARSVRQTVTRDARMSHRDSAAPPANPIAIPPSVKTETANVTRDNVTVTPDQNRVFKETPIASTSTADVVGPNGLAREARKIAAVSERDPANWLRQDGLQLIMDRMAEPRERAMARLSNWSGQVGDCAVLANILQGAENRAGPAFHMEVSDQIRRLAH
jgi:hypothetical protein